MVPARHSPWLPVEIPIGTGRANLDLRLSVAAATNDGAAGNALIAPVTTVETGTPSRMAGSPRTSGERVKSLTRAWPFSSTATAVPTTPGILSSWSLCRAWAATARLRVEAGPLGVVGAAPLGLVGSDASGPQLERTMLARATTESRARRHCWPKRLFMERLETTRCGKQSVVADRRKRGPMLPSETSDVNCGYQR